MTSLDDVIVLGGGPAALCLAAALAEQALQVSLLAPHDLPAPWPNTYGIWVDEVEALGLAHLLEHRWSHTVSYFGAGAADPGPFRQVGQRVLGLGPVDTPVQVQEPHVDELSVVEEAERGQRRFDRVAIAGAFQFRTQLLEILAQLVGRERARRRRGVCCCCCRVVCCCCRVVSC